MNEFFCTIMNTQGLLTDAATQALVRMAEGQSKAGRLVRHWYSADTMPSNIQELLSAKVVLYSKGVCMGRKGVWVWVPPEHAHDILAIYRRHDVRNT